MPEITFTSVLPSSAEANFEITHCATHVNIDKNLFKAVFTVNYKLKKVANNSTSEDTWTEGTSANESDCVLLSVPDKNGGAYRTKSVPNEGKIAFLIEFQKVYAIGDEVEFEIKYQRSLLRKEVEKGLLFKRYLLVVETIFANVCRNLEIEFSFQNEKCHLLECIPNKHQSENGKISFKKDILRPHEVYTVGLLMHSGLLQRRESKLISGLSLMVVGAIVSNLVNELIKLI